MNDQEQRLIDLETRIAFQERALEEVSAELYRQGQQLKFLEERVRDLLRHVRPSVVGDDSNEPPPHY